MIEKTVLDYLNGADLGAEAYMEVPEQRPERFIVIDKTGSSKRDHICVAQIAIQSYATSLFEAASLNDLVKEAMGSLASLPNVSACKLNSDYNFTDTEAKEYRYQAVFNITHY